MPINPLRPFNALSALGPLVLVAPMALVACSPALDWREVRPEGSGALVLFPCKPTHHARQVALAGQDVLLNLVACTADDVTWAVAFTELGDPTRMTPALAALQAASLDNLGAEASASRALPLKVSGATPYPGAGRVAFEGRRPDGSALQAQVAVFAKGTRAFQATVIGNRLPAEGLETFFDGLRTTE